MKLHKLAICVAAVSFASGAAALNVADVDGTKLAIGGYFKAEGVFNKPDSDAANSVDNNFKGSARQSRLNIKATRTEDGHNITGFIEGDFYGNDYTSAGKEFLRLRHAYVGVDNIVAGKTWGGNFFATAPFDAEMINFWGQGLGTIAGNGGTVRPELVVHYVNKGFRFSAQDPVYTDAAYPDMVASYTSRSDSLAWNLAMTARDVQKGDSATSDDSHLGIGVSLAVKYSLGQDAIHFSTYTGKGLSVFTNIGVGGVNNPGTYWKSDAEDGKLVAQTGYVLGYKHQFSDKLRGTARYGHVAVDDTADSDFSVTNVNMIYTYTKSVDLGVEWRSQSKDTLNNTSNFVNIRPKGKQLEMMMMYKF